MKLYDLGKIIATISISLFQIRLSRSQSLTRSQGMKGSAAKRQNDQIQNNRLYYCQHREIIPSTA